MDGLSAKNFFANIGFYRDTRQVNDKRGESWMTAGGGTGVDLIQKRSMRNLQPV